VTSGLASFTHLLQLLPCFADTRAPWVRKCPGLNPVLGRTLASWGVGRQPAVPNAKISSHGRKGECAAARPTGLNKEGL
jgi:hypothetical protein